MRRSTMLLTSTGLLAITTAFAFSVSACGGSDQQPATAPSSAYPQQQYPQQQYPQQQYPQQQYPQTQPTAAPTATMATPGPLALPCQNDGACGLHRCNTQFQKCAFPCQSEADCAQGNQCMMGVCAPKMGP
ncbi:MAG: hypothetical protein J0I07_01495 [Myxococcales bacterium]|nr:hypothetical protein [Myxococcales bacterium]